MEGDNYVFKNSLLSEKVDVPFLDKKVVWISDNNSSTSYQSNQIQYDLSAVANSESWIDWSSSYLEIPVCVVVENTNLTDIPDFRTLINSGFLSLKSSGFNLIQSCSIQYNNSNVVQLTNNINEYIQWRLLTDDLGQDNKQKWGSSMFFSKDTPTAVKLSEAASGQGFSNNRPSFATTALDSSGAGFYGSPANEGFAERIKNTVDTQNTSFYSAVIDNADAKQVALSSMYCPDISHAVFTFQAILPLKHLSNFFQQLGLVKRGFVTMTLNVNSSKQTISYDKDTATMTVSSLSVNGSCNPIMISSAAVNQPNYWIDGALGAGETATFFVSAGIVTAPDSTNTLYQVNGGPTSTRVYFQTYTISPEYEKVLLAKRIKRVIYEDVYSYIINKVEAGGQTQALITNGISRMKEVVVVPFFNKDANTGLTSYPITSSPFTHEPGLPSTCAYLSQFNVAISGKNLFQNDQQYSWSQFVDELSELGINGGKTITSSGLYSQQDYTFAPYYVANAGRRLEGDNIARSVQILATNQTQKPLDLHCFITYYRELVIDISSGESQSVDASFYR